MKLVVSITNILKDIHLKNYEDIKNGCNKFYLKSGEEYKKFIRIVNDM